MSGAAIVLACGLVLAARSASLASVARRRPLGERPVGAARVGAAGLPVPARVRRVCERALLPAEVWSWGVPLGGATSVALGVLVGPVHAVLAAVLLVVGAVVIVSALGDRRARRLRSLLPEFVDQLGRSLATGSDVVTSLTEASSGDDGLDEASQLLAARVRRGLPLADALRDFEDEVGEPELRLVSAALLVGVESGGSRARAVERVASTLAERRAVAADAAALAAQARMSAVVLGAAPAAFALFAAAVDPRIVSFYLGSPAGTASLVTGLLLLAAGGSWMARVVRDV